MPSRTRTLLLTLAALLLMAFESHSHAQPVRRFERSTVSGAALELLRQQPPTRILKLQPDGIETLQVQDLRSITLDSIDQMAVIPRGEDLLAAQWVQNQPAFPARGPILALPEDYLVRVEEEEPTLVRPLLQAPGPMRYQAESGVFLGTLWIILNDEARPAERRRINPPLSLRLASPAESVSPSELILDSTNVVAQVVFEARNPMDSVPVTLITDVRPSGYHTRIPVEPALIIETEGRSLQGWGIQRIPVAVVVRGATLSDSVAVTLQATRGSVTPATVFVSSNKAGLAELRSEGLGRADLSVVHPMFVSARTTFSYEFPWSYLIFALVGALVGGLLAHWRNLKLDRPSKLGRNLGGAVAWALVVTAAYLGLEVNLLSTNLPVVSGFSEIIVFAISALAGLVWAREPERKTAPI